MVLVDLKVVAVELVLVDLLMVLAVVAFEKCQESQGEEFIHIVKDIRGDGSSLMAVV